MILLGQVSKHLQTLVKYLRDIVAKTEDPVTIEQTQRQIKSIEKVLSDVKRVVRHSNTKRRDETLFGMSESEGGQARSSIEAGFKEPLQRPVIHEILIENPEIKIQTKRAKMEESVLKGNVLTTDCDDDKVKEKLLKSSSKRTIKATDKIQLRSEARRSKTSMQVQSLLSDTE